MENDTFEIACEDFLHYLKYVRRLSEHTVLAYGRDIGAFSSFCSVQYELRHPAGVNGIHIRSWLSELKSAGLSARSLRRKRSALQALFLYLKRQGKVTVNPLRQVLLPKVPARLPRFLEEDQVERLTLDAVLPEDLEGRTHRLILDLLYQSGMRRAELVGLAEQDVDWARKEVRVHGKGGKQRILPLQTTLLEDLRGYIELKRKIFAEPTEKLLTLKSGKPLYDQYVYRVVKKYLSGITTLEKKSPHVLRHSFASHLLNNGASMMAIKDLLGHSSLASTQVYTHLNIEKLKSEYRKAHPKSG